MEPRDPVATESAADTAQPASQKVTMERVLRLLAGGKMALEGLLPHSSNYTFLATLKDDSLECLAVYKPQQGERPLWDFPRGTLCLREYATYLAAVAIGWIMVPPTVLRQGPHGLGAVQLYVDAQDNCNYFSLRDSHVPTFQRLAVFDYIVNNTDRKGGHCLLGSDGRIWAIDHGITFHQDFKLRTVIWDWAGEPLPADIVTELEAFRPLLAPRAELSKSLSQLLSAAEMRALRRRLDTLLATGAFPEPDENLPNVPWPMM